MKLAVIGFGNAGGKIVDELLRADAAERQLCRVGVVFNTAQVDLARLELVPEDKRILIGQTDQRSKGGGVGADPDLGAEIAEADKAEIERALDDVPLHDIDAFLIVAGLGGGTGSGGAPVLAEELADRYGESVYGLAILPSSDEGGRATLNAARTLPTFTESTDALLLFDNDAWRSGTDSVQGGYEKTNREIAARVTTLLSAGERDGSQISENAMDASDVRRTMATGGVATIAYAETDLRSSTKRQRGLVGRFRSNGTAGANESDPATKIHGLVRRAVRSRLTCPADVTSAERGLIVVSGPPEEFSRKGLERARRWVEQEIESVEVLAGDDPRRDAESLSAAVLLSNVTDVPRIDELQETAVSAKDNVESQAVGRETAVEDLVTDDDDALDPV
jgi:cell division GTPase FtsZ